MIRRLLSSVAIAAIAGAAVFVWSCNDPVHDAQVDALGAEPAGETPGPKHRPGKPCLTCHGGQGPADLELSVAGTIYATAAPDSPPLVNATVTIYDATQNADAGGVPHTFVTNGAGNFYASRSDWSPVFPLHDISIKAQNLDTPTLMHTNIGREGSCASCHFDPRGNDSRGHVYLVLEAADLPGVMP
jgi:hypothetical protein